MQLVPKLDIAPRKVNADLHSGHDRGKATHDGKPRSPFGQDSILGDDAGEGKRSSVVSALEGVHVTCHSPASSYGGGNAGK